MVHFNKLSCIFYIRFFLLGIGLAWTLSACDRSIPNNGEQMTAPVDVSTVIVTPAKIRIQVGQTFQMKAMLGDAAGNLIPKRMPSAPGAEKRSQTIGEKLGMAGRIVTWISSQPSLAQVDREGLVTALAVGNATITATSGERSAVAEINVSDEQESPVKVDAAIAPDKAIFGLDFPGNAGVDKTMRFEFTAPPPAYPATYIWRVYPRQQQSYYTAFFWGNNGEIYKLNTYYGFHPYPDWNAANQHFWEIAAAPGGDFLSDSHVIYDRWYIQVAICRQFDDKTVQEFYWDWPDTTKVIRHTGNKSDNPPVPALIVGDAPWNPGHEVWDGVLRGFQFYDEALSPEEITREIDSPGAIRNPWYLNRDPTPDNISDQSGSDHQPTWVGVERPALWTGKLIKNSIIRTTVPPR